MLLKKKRPGCVVFSSQVSICTKGCCWRNTLSSILLSFSWSVVTETMKILDGMQQFIPSKMLVTRPSDPSWWTPECTAAVCAKQLSWKRVPRNPVQQNEDRYRLSSSNCAAACIRQANACESARPRRLLHSGSLPCKKMVVNHQKSRR